MKITNAKIAGLFLSTALISCGLGSQQGMAQGMPSAPSAENTDPACGSTDDLKATMKKDFAEEQALTAQAGPNAAYILFATPPGAQLNGKATDTWTLLVANTKDKMACGVTAGEHFRMVTNRKARIVPGLVEVGNLPAQNDDEPGEDRATLQCVPHSKAVAFLEKGKGLVRLAYGQTRENHLLEIYGIAAGSKDRSGAVIPSIFAIIESDSTGKTCMVGHGKDISLNPAMLSKYPKDQKPGY